MLAWRDGSGIGESFWDQRPDRPVTGRPHWCSPFFQRTTVGIEALRNNRVPEAEERGSKSVGQTGETARE